MYGGYFGRMGKPSTLHACQGVSLSKLRNRTRVGAIWTCSDPRARIQEGESKRLRGALSRAFFRLRFRLEWLKNDTERVFLLKAVSG